MHCPGLHLSCRGNLGQLLRPCGNTTLWYGVSENVKKLVPCLSELTKYIFTVHLDIVSLFTDFYSSLICWIKLDFFCNDYVRHEPYRQSIRHIRKASVSRLWSDCEVELKFKQLILILWNNIHKIRTLSWVLSLGSVPIDIGNKMNWRVSWAKHIV